MKKFDWFFLGLVALLLSAVAYEVYGAEYMDNPDGTAVITLTAEDAKSCADGGGCQIITNKRHERDVVAIAKLIRECRGKGAGI